MITAVHPVDPDLARFNAATATIAAGFDIEAHAQDLRGAARSGDRALVRELHCRLTETITRVGEFIDVAFPGEGR